MDIVMLQRLLKLPKNHSFFLFGARGTGKSTLLYDIFKPSDISLPASASASTSTTPDQGSSTLLINLLDPVLEDRLSRLPNELVAITQGLPTTTSHIIIDEIQKVPKLLDIVHYLIESTPKKFVLTGSSARKLKYGGANLLAGRAFVYHLHPFSLQELGAQFSLEETLQWGTLPRIQALSTTLEKQQFLQAYAHTYLKEEIWAEQFIRDLDPFRYFLEVAAQMNGKIINFEKISRDVGVDDKTVKRYYSILEDTLIGFFLNPFHHSFRKRTSAKPKFYFFDIGVTHALSRRLSIPLQPGTSAYGETFEHLVILEAMKLASYFHTEYRFSYLTTKDNAEIDLVVERPGKPILFIEIKSSTEVGRTDLTTFIKLTQDFGECEAVCFCNDMFLKKIENIKVMPWRQGIVEYFSDVE